MSNDLEMMKAMASLFRKKAAVMQALEGGMAKQGKNDFFKYSYITASAVKHVVGQAFAANGLSFQMSGVDAQNIMVPVTKKRDNVYVTEEALILRVQFQITLCDTDTGATEQSYWFGEAVVSGQDDKAASKAATSALKYYLLSNLMIGDADEDANDTDNDSHKKQKPAPQRPQPVPRPQEHAPAKPAAPAWWGIMKDVKPLMTAGEFDGITADLKAGLFEGRISADMSDTNARLMLHEEFGIDVRKKSAARPLDMRGITEDEFSPPNGS